jgi:flavin-dependent dehydrogenase
LPVSGMIVTGPGGARVVGDYEGDVCGVAIARHHLDQVLLDEAVRAGVTFDAGVVVRGPLMSGDGSRVVGVRLAGSKGEHDLHGRIVIGADGRHSRLAFTMGLARYVRQPRRWAFGAYYAGVEGLSTRGEMHIRADGYIGVAPLPDRITNVCVVRELGGARGAHKVDADTAIEQAIAGDPQLRDRLARARRLSAVTVLGPLGVESIDVGRPGLLLAGDAAGFIDPMTGDGLRFAIRGAELAAAAALRELESGRPMHQVLRAERRREFAAKWRINRALRALVASPRAIGAAATVASYWQAPVRRLISIAGDVGAGRNRA